MSRIRPGCRSPARSASTGLMAIIDSGGFGMAVASPGGAIVDDGGDVGDQVPLTRIGPGDRNIRLYPTGWRGTMDLIDWAIWQTTPPSGPCPGRKTLHGTVARARRQTADELSSLLAPSREVLPDWAVRPVCSFSASTSWPRPGACRGCRAWPPPPRSNAPAVRLPRRTRRPDRAARPASGPASRHARGRTAQTWPPGRASPSGAAPSNSTTARPGHTVRTAPGRGRAGW